MYYFDYFEGVFYVEYKLCGEPETVDCLYCFQYKEIKNWCESQNIDFPFEINSSYIDLFLEEDNTKSPEFNIQKFIDSFRELVRNSKIKIYC